MTQDGPTRVATWLGRVVAVAGLAVLVTWAAVPGWAADVGMTRPGGALALCLLGLLVSGTPSGGLRVAALGSAAALGAAGLVAWQLDLAPTLFPAAACCVLLLVAALAARPHPRLVSYLGLVAFALAYVGGLAHLYGVTDLSRIQSVTAMTASSSPALLALAVAVLVGDDRLPLVAALRAPGTAGALVRRLLVWTLLLPPAAGWLLLHGTRLGWVDDAYGLSVMTLASTAGAALLVLLGARTAARTDRARETAVRDLAELNAELADRVAAAVAEVRRGEEQFRVAMAHAPIGMALVEIDGRFREVNRALCRLLGYDERELVGRTFQQLTHPDDLDADLDNVARLLDGSLDHYAMEKRYLTRDGDVVWVLLAVSLARAADDRPAYFVAQIQDITAAREAQERLEHRALHDPLTGLPNRDLLMDHLSHALARAARSGTSTAVMFCDLDRFKAVNDTYGHEAGDQLLVAVADRLREVTRPGDTVARLGGDEFVVVAEGIPDPDAARAMAERVRRSFDQPVQVGPAMVRPSASIGVAVATAEDDARSALREADAAMYRAKALGRGRLEVSPATARPAMALVRQHPSAVRDVDQHPA